MTFLLASALRGHCWLINWPYFNTALRKGRGGEKFSSEAPKVHTTFINVLSSLSYRCRVRNKTEDHY